MSTESGSQFGVFSLEVIVGQSRILFLFLLSYSFYIIDQYINFVVLVVNSLGKVPDAWEICKIHELHEKAVSLGI